MYMWSGPISLELEMYIKAPPGNCGAHVRMTALRWPVASGGTAGQRRLYSTGVYCERCEMQRLTLWLM